MRLFLLDTLFITLLFLLSVRDDSGLLEAATTDALLVRRLLVALYLWQLLTFILLDLNPSQLPLTL
jgi:hypothetical protein